MRRAAIAPRLFGTVITFLGSVLTDPDPSLSPDPELGNGVLIMDGATRVQRYTCTHTIVIIMNVMYTAIMNAVIRIIWNGINFSSRGN